MSRHGIPNRILNPPSSARSSASCSNLARASSSRLGSAASPSTRNIYFVDLVFYNRLLRCYVLIDLKLGKLTHQDLGQMQMYVNYFDREVKTPEELPTVGIILCKQRNKALVRITLPRDSNIHA